MKKKVLLTGTQGYVVTKLSEFLEKQGHEITKVSLKNNDWEQLNFNEFDTVVHLASIVHNNNKVATLDDYMKINALLTEKIAQKSKEEGIEHFIFFSTMSVYGEEGSVLRNIIIDEQTKLNPKNAYGISKVAAEELLLDLKDKNFKVSILRPPMIYGKNAPGNFDKLIKVSKISPMFPKIHNRRSIIFIDNLTQYVEMVIRKQIKGILHPQDSQYLDTTTTLTYMRNYLSKKTKLINIPNFYFSILNKINVFRKIYGNLIYSQEIDKIEKDFEEVPFEKALYKTLK